jgi:hypothetical protein
VTPISIGGYGSVKSLNKKRIATYIELISAYPEVISAYPQLKNLYLRVETKCEATQYENKQKEPNNVEDNSVNPEVIAASAPEPPKKQKHGTVNAQQLADLQSAENIARVAQREVFAVKLANSGISAESVRVLLADIQQCRELITGATNFGTNRSKATKIERTNEDILLEDLRAIQAAASQKYARKPTERIRLKDYRLNVALGSGRAALSQFAEDILAAATNETLPGISATFLDEARTHFADWKDADETQSKAKQAGQAARLEARELLKTITDRRIELQFAAERHFPHTSSKNADARAAFALPERRPFRIAR